MLEMQVKLQIPKERIKNLNEYAIQRYGMLCEKLYEKKIISNPSVFNYMDFFEYLYDNYYEDCDSLLGYGAKMSRDSLYIEYVLSRLSNTYFKRLLKIYHDIIECEEMLDLVQNFVSKGNKANIEVVPRYFFSKGFVLNCTIDLENRNMKYLLNQREKSLNPYYLKALEKRVEPKSKDRVILRDEKEDDKYFDLILSGKIVGETEYAKEVNTYLVGLNYELTKEELFLDIKEEVEKEFKKANLLYITKSGVFTKTKEKEIVFPKVIGTFVHAYDNSTLSKSNILDGWTGEFVSVAEIEEKGYLTKGMPISLYKEKGKRKEKYFPIFLVYSPLNLLYPLNPRYQYDNTKEIKLRRRRFPDKEEQAYFDEVREILTRKVSTREVKISLSEEKEKEVKKEICELLEK